MPANKIQELYRELRKKHGAPAGQWQLWCKRNKTKQEREEVIIGAILTQNTNWRNVSKAIANLKKARACSLSKIRRLGQYSRERTKLQEMIRPSGFYRVKAQYLVNIADYFFEINGVSSAKKLKLAKIRKQLLALKGVGRETADSILNYALGKPIFIIDAYTKRLVKRLKLARKLDYEHLQHLFEDKIRRDHRLYQDFHALIVIDAKN